MAGFSARWSNLITKCWAPAPADRLSFNDIVAYCESTLVVVGGQAPPTAFSASPTSSSLSLGMLTSFGRSASMSPQASLSNHYAEPNLHGANNNSMTRQSLTHQASSMHQHQQHQLSQSFQSQAVRSQQPTISNNNNNNNNYVTTEDSPTRFVIENTVILNGHNGAVSCLHTNEGSDSVLSGSTDATIMVKYSVAINQSTVQASLLSWREQIWSDANGARLHAMTAHNAYVFCLETGDVQSTPVMISGSRDTSIRIWDQRGSMLLALNGAFRCSSICVSFCVSIGVFDSNAAPCKTQKAIRAACET
jgi:WD40 repeat protein